MTPEPSGVPPASEIEITVDLVVDLLRQQHEDLAALPVHVAAEGWDNVILRLGDHLAVRIPRRDASAKLIENEIAWLPKLAPFLPLPVPVPVRTGQPTAFYPWRWSVVPWVPGRPALVDPLFPAEAGRLGSFLQQLHAVGIPSYPPVNPFRGVPLSERQDALGDLLAQLGADQEGASLHGPATAAVSAGVASVIDTDPVWIHGDLHAKNTISDNGRIVAIVDWGDMCVGDKATDLACVWMLFDPAHDVDFWNAYGNVSDATMVRARAWAVLFGLTIWTNHREADPTFAANGLTTIRRATAH